MKNTPRYFLLSCLVLMLLASCKKDKLTLSPVGPIPMSNCGDESILLDVGFYVGTTAGLVNVPVCVCDTVEFSLTNVDPSWLFIGWTVIDPILGPYFEPLTTLRLENPDPTIWISADFDDGSVPGQFPSLFVILNEDQDC